MQATILRPARFTKAARDELIRPEPPLRPAVGSTETLSYGGPALSGRRPNHRDRFAPCISPGVSDDDRNVRSRDTGVGGDSLLNAVTDSPAHSVATRAAKPRSPKHQRCFEPFGRSVCGRPVGVRTASGTSRSRAAHGELPSRLVRACAHSQPPSRNRLTRAAASDAASVTGHRTVPPARGVTEPNGRRPEVTRSLQVEVAGVGDDHPAALPTAGHLAAPLSVTRLLPDSPAVSRRTRNFYTTPVQSHTGA